MRHLIAVKLDQKLYQDTFLNRRRKCGNVFYSESRCCWSVGSIVLSSCKGRKQLFVIGSRPAPSRSGLHPVRAAEGSAQATKFKCRKGEAAKLWE